ncbi:MAG: superoxide dismutase, Ni [Euryarchaeota archaeon]|jgi:nickel superoxide dismutase|nr:superoxide dismutase, Ni [Euryarchaeota archaeon]MDP6378863.1 superoxide dismutase, Ni [Candidatus Thalassarchaeaceae archaeon]|tara:strand:- start:182 stop:634 length:453 start_codon:yes stop_codon:yes gene_type:complete
MTDQIEPIEAEAHCDGPCGVYDPASARIAAEAVQSMTTKMNALNNPIANGTNDQFIAYLNTMSRYAAIKEEEAQKCKDELLILWTDFFKPQHLESIPNLHDKFWQAAKLCSACKVEVSDQHAQELIDACEEIHNIFWAAKGLDVPWIRAS